MPPSEDWYGLLERLLEGDSLALARLTRLVASFLARWNAYDFEQEWDDLIQEVLLAGARAVRDGKLRDRQAAAAFLKSTTRFKYADRLKAHLQRSEDEHLPWDDVVEAELDAPVESPESGRDLRDALGRLNADHRRAVVAVYVEGCTYEEAVEATGIPLGSLKRYLRDGLAQLREDLAGAGEPE